MKILLTGASGFLGRHIASYFADEELVTMGRTQGDIIAQLDYEMPVVPVVDLVIHAAGKAHVMPKTPAEEKEFYQVNVQGTLNLLSALALNAHLPKYFILISTIAVYGEDTGSLIAEEAPLKASDAYGKSKIEAENLVQSWCAARNVSYTILRLPLIAGSNPPGNLKSMIKGIRRGYYLNFAEGRARKSMVLASSIPPILLTAASKGGIYNLTDGYHPSFAELSALIAAQLGKKRPKSLPKSVAGLFALIGELIGKKSPLNKKNYKKMINDLTFDDSKARDVLGWNPESVIESFKI